MRRLPVLFFTITILSQFGTTPAGSQDIFTEGAAAIENTRKMVGKLNEETKQKEELIKTSLNPKVKPATPVAKPEKSPASGKIEKNGEKIARPKIFKSIATPPQKSKNIENIAKSTPIQSNHEAATLPEKKRNIEAVSVHTLRESLKNPFIFEGLLRKFKSFRKKVVATESINQNPPAYEPIVRTRRSIPTTGGRRGWVNISNIPLHRLRHKVLILEKRHTIYKYPESSSSAIYQAVPGKYLYVKGKINGWFLVDY